MQYWRDLCPTLRVCNAGSAALARRSVLQVDPATIDVCQERMRHDGYFDLMAGTAGELPWAVDLAVLADGIQTLRRHGWQPSWILMYDEGWIISHQVKELVFKCTGNALIMDFALFNVGGDSDSNPTTGGKSDPKTGKGWAPHRDRGEDHTVTAFGADGMPGYSTTWIALSDATAVNSCLYVVPRQHDEGYMAGDNGKNPLETIFKSQSSFQAIRALPAPAGSLIHFSHRLFHWGSAADPEVRAWSGNQDPRVAISFASATDAFELPYFDRAHLPIPPIALRASLVAGLALMYVANEDPGCFRVGLWWDVFTHGTDKEALTFDPHFAKVVAANYSAYIS